jgi:hypothetical protein
VIPADMIDLLSSFSYIILQQGNHYLLRMLQ